MKHRSAGVRRNAALVQRRTAENVVAILAADLLSDTDAHVRLAALLALATPNNEDKELGKGGFVLPVVETGPNLVALLDRPEIMEDRWLPDALTIAAAANSSSFIEALAKRKNDLSPARSELLRPLPAITPHTRMVSC